MSQLIQQTSKKKLYFIQRNNQ